MALCSSRLHSRRFLKCKRSQPSNSTKRPTNDSRFLSTPSRYSASGECANTIDSMTMADAMVEDATVSYIPHLPVISNLGLLHYRVGNDGGWGSFEKSDGDGRIEMRMGQWRNRVKKGSEDQNPVYTSTRYIRDQKFHTVR
jgi:hypothetical protein